MRILTTIVVAAWLGCSASDDERDDGPPAGVEAGCVKTCEVPRDCCAAFPDSSYMDCYAHIGEFPYLFACDDGTCKLTGCREDTDCTGSGFTCHVATDDVGYCVRSCTDDTDCEAGSSQPVCGALFDGFPICTAPPCMVDADCPTDSFHCEAGDCVFQDCDTDEDCEHGGTCNAEHQCRCEHHSECNDSFDCVALPS